MWNVELKDIKSSAIMIGTPPTPSAPRELGRGSCKQEDYEED